MTFQLPARRLMLAGVFAVAVAVAPAVAAVAGPTTSPAAPVATCTPGEEHDVYTTTCTPMLVPNSPSFAGIPGNPDVPALSLPGEGSASIPCIGAESNLCIAEGAQAADEGPQPVPRSTVSASP